MGSSMVMMCSWRSLLTLSIMAASVVDLPEPVGPVTRISPRGFSHSLETMGGRFNCTNDLISNGMTRNTAPVADVGAEARQALHAEGKIEFEVFLEAVLLRVGHDAVSELLGIGGAELRQVERLQAAVHAHL